MGEEEKKPAEEKKMEEKETGGGKKPKEEKKEETKQAEKPAEEKKEEKKGEGKEDALAPPPPPSPEIILKVYMHCEGCARKVRRCLKGFEGVEDVMTDCKSHKVVVKGEKTDPMKVLQRVQRKSHRQVELISPIPKPPAEDEKKDEEKEKPKPEGKKEEPPQVITVVLKVHMHCEACAQQIKKRIQRMKGVESAEPDLKNSEVTVKGMFDPAKLVDYVHKRTSKQAVVVKQDPEKNEEENAKDANKDEKKVEEGGHKEMKESGGDDKEKKEGDDAKGETETAADGGAEETKVVEVKSNQYIYYPSPSYAMEMYGYPPQIFSDENPNACSVM